MSRSPSPDDFFRKQRELEQRIARLELQSRAHTETKTFIIGPDIDSSLDVPRAVLNVNPEDGAPETKRLYATHCELATGSASVRFLLNGVEFMVHAATTTASDEDVETYMGDPVYLPANQTSWLGIEIVSGTGTVLSAGVTIITGR